MGTVTQQLALAAHAAGVHIETSRCNADVAPACASLLYARSAVRGCSCRMRCCDECRTVHSVSVGSCGAASGVQFDNGSELRANVVVVCSDPFELQRLAGHAFPESFNEFINGLRKDGTTMKVRQAVIYMRTLQRSNLLLNQTQRCTQVNLALSELPCFTCLPEARGQHRTTTHILPDESVVIESLMQVTPC